MSKARTQRLKAAKEWYPAQHFTEDSHVVKAYRKKFNVDRICAMKELCMIKVLSPKKQADYERQLQKHKEKRSRKKQKKQEEEFDGYGIDYDENFWYIAGFTSGGFPYGITWEQAEAEGMIEEAEE